MKKAFFTTVALLAVFSPVFANYPISAYINSTSGSALYNTGLQVQVGSLLNITNDFYDTWTLGAYDRESNADGLGNPFGGNQYGYWSQDGQSFLYGVMVGRIDNNPYFLVGTNYNQIAQNTGTLYLGCWDSNYEDNSGWITATIQNTYSLPIGAPIPATIPTMILGGISGLTFFKRKK